MIEYLEKLIQDKEFKQALTYAEELLASQDWTRRDFVMIQCTILTARYYLGEYEAAVSVAELVLSAAKEVGLWDYHGNACRDLGSSLYCLNRFDDAISVWYELLENLSHYTRAAEHESAVWYNIAMAHTAKGEFMQASKAMTRATDAASRVGNHRLAHGFRHALIETCLRTGELEQIPRLLSKCLHYLRHNPTAQKHLDSTLWHYKLRADFALATNRPVKAMLLAVKGLRMAEGDPVHQYNFHMLLAEYWKRGGKREVALGHLVAAGLYAASGRRSDLEAQANEQAYALLQGDADLMGRSDRYHFSEELDVH